MITILDKKFDYLRIRYLVKYEGSTPSNDEVFAALDTAPLHGGYIQENADGTLQVDIYTE